MKINPYLVAVFSVIVGATVFNLDRIFDLLKVNSSPGNVSPTEVPNSPNSSVSIPSPGNVLPTEVSNSPNSSVSKSNSFFVLAGESFYPDSLANEPNRVKARIGADKFNEFFKDVKSCRSFSDSKKYYLVLGSNLPEEEANKLKQQAIDNYFRPDTYSLQENLIDFNPSDCKKIP